MTNFLPLVEKFHSLQGEGYHTGKSAFFIRLAGCNVGCSWCDTKHSWDQKKYPLISIEKIANETKKARKKGASFLVITGGEPLMATGQTATIGIYEELERQGNLPGSMTFETNGTQKLRQPFIDWVNRIDTEIFFSCSPKLFTVSGEESKKAIKPEVVAEYRKLSSKGQLKFVVGDKDREWNELEEALEKFRSAGVDWPVWIMPVGAREEEQSATAGEVAQKAFRRGYNVAARVHVYLFGNAIGT